MLRSELYAIPALIAAAATVVIIHLDAYSIGTSLGAAAICFLIRMIGVRYDLNAPEPPLRREHG